MNQYTKATEAEKKEYVENFLDSGFSYVGGYVDCDHKVTIRCNTCGFEFERSMVTIRQGSKTQCRNCSRIKRIEAAETVKKNRVAKDALKMEREKQKESERLTDLFLRTRLVECKECGSVFSTTKSNVVFCSADCGRRFANRKRKDRRLSKEKCINRGITAMSLYRRDNGVCWICGGQCDPNDKQSRNGTIICGNMYPSVDHIIPVCDGGEDSWENVRLAHRICNTKRYFAEKITASCQ